MAEAEVKLKKAKKEATKQKRYRIFLSVKVMLKIRGARKSLSSYTGCPEECTCNKPSRILFDNDGRMR